MYPVLFRTGGFEVTSFGPMVAIAALVGLWLFRRELRRSGIGLLAVFETTHHTAYSERKVS
jgi:prolipoprotein diacylglyceryltransferase